MVKFMEKTKKQMLVIIGKAKRRVPVILIATGTMLVVASAPAWAGTTLPFANQITSLITQAGSWITGLIAGSGGLMVGYHALMRNFIDDPQHVSKHTEAIRKVGFGTAIGAGATGLSTWIYSTFHSGSASAGMLLNSHFAVALVTKIFGA